MHILSLFGQSYDTTYYSSNTSASDDGAALVMFLFAIPLLVLMLVALWRIFAKAGRPGWAALVPIYNAYVELKIIGRPGWWVLLYFIPLVNIAISIIVAIELGKAFGKSTVFSLLALWLFSPVGQLIIGFGKATYQGIPKHVEL